MVKHELKQSAIDAITKDVVDALNESNNPSVTNPIATLNDVSAGTLTSDERDAIKDSNKPSSTNVFLTEKDLDLQDFTTVNQSASSSFSLSGVASKTKFIGDTRDVSGHTWCNYWSTGGSPASKLNILATFAGAGSGYATLSNSTGVITVTATTTNPNFTDAGVTTSDLIYWCDESGNVNLTHYSPTDVTNNVITLDLAPTGSWGFGSALCIAPNVKITNTSNTLTVASNQVIYFKGLHLYNMTITVYGKAYFENCLFETVYPLTVTDKGKIYFVGYNNTIFNTTLGSAVRILRRAEMEGQITILKTSYSDPSKFKLAAIQAHTGGKVSSTNSRSLWTAFGIVSEDGAEIIADEYVAIKTYRDGLVSRGGHIYSNNIGLYRGTSGYCAWSEYGNIHIPNSILHNAGGSTTYNVYTSSVDNE